MALSSGGLRSVVMLSLRTTPFRNTLCERRFWSYKGFSNALNHQFSHRFFRSYAFRTLSMCGAVGTSVFVCLYGLKRTSQSPVYALSSDSYRAKHNFIADVVEKIAPAVVHISIKARHLGANIAVSNGSGFIVREDGIILTNAHVVANKQSVDVILHDGRTVRGVVQAIDPVSDLATVRVNETGLPVMKLGKSSEVRSGEFVVAVGSPLQLSNSVTAGIVSSVHRDSSELGLGKDMEFIQTDAAITFGNSGGPLVNLDGEAIGINTMKVTAGISFAIPSDYAQQFLDRVYEMEKRTSGWQKKPEPAPPRRYVGVSLLTLTANLAHELRSRGSFAPADDVASGVFVANVVLGSPAAKAGIRPGDVIIAVNGTAVKTTTEVYKLVQQWSRLNWTVRRGVETKQMTVSSETSD